MRLKDQSRICEHIRMAAAATTIPSDLYQILFHFHVICHHSRHNSLFSTKSLVFFFSFFQLEGTKRRGQRGVAFVLVPLRLPPLPLSFSCLPSVEHWCDYYTFSRGFNHGPVGPSPRGGPDFNARVLLFPPVYCLAFYSARQSHWHQGALRITCPRRSDPWTLNQPPYTGIDPRSENAQVGTS